MTIVIKTAVVHVVHEVYVMMQLSKNCFLYCCKKISAVLESLEFKEFNFHAFCGHSQNIIHKCLVFFTETFDTYCKFLFYAST